MNMNQQVSSVLISCLLASTFFHGLQAFSLAVNNFGPASRTKRSPESTGSLTLSVLNDILIVRNTSSDRAVLIDTQKDIILLLDGGDSSGIVISQQQNEATLIPNGLWNAAEETLTYYLKSLGNEISTLLHRPNCTDFTIPRVHISILKNITVIVQDLVYVIDPELERRPEYALESILSIASGIEDLLKGSIKGILVVIGDDQIELTYGVSVGGVQNIFKGIDIINGYLNDTAEDAISRDDRLELRSVFGARDGLAGLSQILHALGETRDLSPLNSHLGDPETFAKLVAQFGGHGHFGITGTFRVVGEILSLLKGESSLERVISILIQVVAQSSEVVKNDFNGQFINSLSNVLEILEEIGATEGLRGLVSIVIDLIKEELIVDGVNISKIISTILTGIAGPKDELLNVIITVLQSLSPVVDPSQSLPELLLVLIIQLDSAVGINNLILLGFDLGSQGCACSLLLVALEAIPELVNELSKDLYGAVSKLPILGNLILALEAVLEVANLNLRQLLNASALVQNQILGVIQLVSEVDLGISRDQVKQCGDLLNTCNGLSVLIAVEVTVTVVVIR